MTTSLLNSLLRALLRWGAALVFCLPLRHRTHFWARACGMLFPLLLLAQLLDPLAQSTTLWQQQLLLLVLYISFFALLGGMIYLCTDINKKGALYCAVWSLLIAQCAYESWCFLELQFTRYGHPLNMASPWAVLVQLLSGAVFFAAVYILLRGSFLIKENTTSGLGSCSARSSLASCSWCRPPCWTMPAPNRLR